MHGRLHGSLANQRFEREGRILARLEHPRIARLIDAGVVTDGDGAQPYLVLELVRGQPIDRWCDERQLDIGARLRLFVDVAQAVAAAHAQLVVHRDLKPGNVMVDGQRQVKLLDFGIARLLEDGEDRAGQTATRTGQQAFTPAWSAPEQLRGEPVSTATDVWALGVLLCQLLTGRHPSGLPWASDFTAWIYAAACRRYTGAQALADDLQRHLRNEPVSAVADTLGYRATKFVRRNRLSVGAASVTLLALLAGVLGTTWQALEARARRDVAQAARLDAMAQAQRAGRERLQAVKPRDRAEAMNELMAYALGPMSDKPLLVVDVLERGEVMVARQFQDAPDLQIFLKVQLANFWSHGKELDRMASPLQSARVPAQRAGDIAALTSIDCNLSRIDTDSGNFDLARARWIKLWRPCTGIKPTRLKPESAA